MSTMPVRLGFLAAWPVYYHAPLYRLLADDPRLDFTAIFASSAGVRPFDRGFGLPTSWGADAIDGYRSIFLNAADERTPGGFWSLRDVDVLRVLWRERFEVLCLHGYNTVTHVLASSFQRVLGGAVIYREEQTLLRPRRRWKRAVKRVLLRLLFSHARAVYIGSENKRWFEAYGIAQDRLFFSPYAVDNEQLRQAADKLRSRRPALRKNFGFGDLDAPTFLFVGRLIPEKRVDTLIRAFAAVRTKVHCNLLIAGGGPLEGSLRKLAVDVPDVIFAGFLPSNRVPEAYAASDVCCLLSESETWGLVVNEAMNFGLPVIATTSVGSVTDLVVDEKTGFVVATKCEEQIVTAMRRLAEDPAMRERMGHAARELVSKFSYSRAADGIADSVAAAVGVRRWREVEPLSRRVLG